MKPRLVTIIGPLEGTVFEIVEDPFAIGRESSNHLQIRHKSVSRRHCTIARNGTGLVLEDLDSRHGTFVNGQPAKRRPLDHGDFIKVGGVVFMYLTRPSKGTSHLPPALRLGDQELTAASTVQVPAGDTQKLWFEKLRASLEPSSLAEEYLRALFEISSAVHSIRGTEPLARRILDLISEAVRADRVALWMLDEGQGELLAVHPADQEIDISRTTAERVMNEQESLLCDDVRHARQLDRDEGLHAARIRSLICAPLLLQERALGVLYADTCNPDARFDERHLELVTAFGAIAAFALENARHVEWLEGENRRLRSDRLDHDMVGTSPAMERVFKFVSLVAPTASTVLVRGESGTGKELTAQAIHKNSNRAGQPFVAINCATLSRELLASELFGHEKGAFTGAVKQKIGQLEAADGGTVFLDEVGELPPELQAKLLRALEERTFQRVGGTRQVDVDIRVIAATNRDLEAAIREGTFREDLYYRLNVISLTLPPLRERREDIPLLANHFMARYRQMHNRCIDGLSPAAISCLTRYDWPGNVRELANAIERAVVLGQGDDVQPEDLPEGVLECQGEADSEPATFHEAVNQAKRRIIRQALEGSGGSVAGAARQLSLHRNYLHRLLRNLGIKTSR